MKYNFPNVSPGMCGLNSANQSNNSAFLGNLNAEFAFSAVPNLTSDYLLLPQRLPRLGLYEELYENETKEYQKLRSKFIQDLKNRFMNLEKSSHNIIAKSNRINILSRWGIYDDIEDSLFLDMNNEENYFYNYILSGLKINLAFSKDCEISDDLFPPKWQYHIAKIVKENWILGGLYLASAAVAIERLNKSQDQIVINASNDFISRYFAEVPSSLGNSIKLSSIFRGLSMIRAYSINQKNDLLCKSEALLKNQIPETNQDFYAYRDALFTTGLTLQKWALGNPSFRNVQDIFDELKQIDPLDSTIYSELGIYYFKKGEIRQALDNFKKASDLGPPSLALNLFFTGEMYKILGDDDEAFKSYKSSVNADRFGISSRIEIIRMHRKRDQKSDLKNSIDEIMQSPDLRSQLTEEEKIEFQGS